MAFEIEYHAPAKPDVVLATIRRESPYSRESEIPQELRTFGTFGVAVRIRESNFQLYREDVNDPPDSLPDLRGHVEPAGSGSRVVGRVGLGRGWVVASCAFSILAIWIFLSDRTGGMVLFALAAGITLWDFLRDRGITREDPTARHLVERLELALSRVEGTASDASTAPAV